MAVCGLCGAFGSRYGAEHGQAYLGAAAGSILGGFAYYRLAFARRGRLEAVVEPEPEIPERNTPRYPPPVRRSDTPDTPPPPRDEDA